MGVYFAQLVHIVGAGFLAREITGSIGGAGQAVWLTSVLTIVLVVIGPPVSQAADYWGRKWFVVVLSLAGCIGCIILGRATSIGMAIGATVIAGHAHGCQPLLHSITSEVLPRKYRPFAQAAINVASGAGSAFGLLVGGTLTLNDPNGWRNYFYMAGGIYGVSAVIVALVYNPPLRDLQRTLTMKEKLRRLDWGGYVLLMIGLVLFCVALSLSQNPYSWNDTQIIAPFVIGIATIIGFIVYESVFKKDGLFHHGLFSRNRNFALAVVCVFVEGLSYFASNNYFSFQLAVLYGNDQFHAGLAFTVASWTYVLSTCLAGIYCTRTKTVRVPLVVAFTLFCIYHVLMSTTNLTTAMNPWGYIAFLGVALGIALNALIVTAQLSTPPELISITTGLMIAVRSLGGTVGIVIYNAVFNSGLSSNLASKVPAAVIPLGLPPSSIGPLIAALTSGNTAALTTIPGATHEVIAAAGLAVHESYNWGFRYVWITAASFSAVGLLSKFVRRNCFAFYILTPG